MKTRVIDAADLAESPELAVLHALEAALVGAEAALFAAYPELDQIDFDVEDPPAISIDANLADTIITSITALNAAISRYAAMIRSRHRPHVFRVGGDGDF